MATTKTSSTKAPTPAAPLKAGTFCFHVTESAFVVDHGYRAVVVVENVPGYQTIGDEHWFGNPGAAQPWFWGDTLEEAREECQRENLRIGISPERALAIVLSSMGAGLAEALRRSAA